MTSASRLRAGILALALCFGAVPAQAQSVASLFTTLPSDFGHLFTPANGIITGVAGAASLAIHLKDDEIAARVYQAEGGRHDFFRPGGPLGDGVTQGAIALGTYIIGRASGSERIGTFGADLVDAQIVNGVLTQGLKAAVDRRRPSGSSHSFPSGHSSATFATAAVIQEHYGWRPALPLYVLGTYVSVSRMVDNHHWASDVIFGAGIGLISGRAASLGHGPSRVSVSPMAIPSGIAIVGSIGQ